MPMTSAYQKKTGDQWLGKSAAPALADLWIGLSLTDPTAAGSLAGEVTGTGYARIDVTPLFGAYDSSTGEATNSAEVNFGAPGSDWGTPAYVMYCTAVSGGAVIYYEQLPSPRFVASGSRPVKFAAGQLKLKHT